MMKIICVGKIKKKYLNDAINDYINRIEKYTKIKIIELKDYCYDVNKTLSEEGKNILSKINDNDYVIITKITGNQMNSKEFSSFIDQNISKNIVFIIGGSYGLSPDVIKRANYSISFSSFTFPHQLFRLILLEQIYRSFKIINNESYHK